MKEALKLGLKIGVAIAVGRIVYSTIYGTHIFIVKKIISAAEKCEAALEKEIDDMKKVDDDDDE